MQAIRGIDHAILATGDLGAAEDAFARLGFAVTPRGLHSAHIGTANATMVFSDGTYLELLGVTAPTEWNVAVREGITAGRNLVGLALKTDDAAAAREALAAKRLDDGPVNTFSRPVGLPDGEHEAAFRTAGIAATTTPGAYTFVCEHLTPEVVWRPDYIVHPNAASGLRAVVGVAEDPGAVAARWEAVAPEAVAMTASKATVSFGNARLEFMTPEAFAAVLGPPPLETPALAAVVLSSADLSATATALAAAGVLNPQGLIVPAHEAAGIIVQFVPD
jgi:hypothetical protein